MAGRRPFAPGVVLLSLFLGCTASVLGQVPAPPAATTTPAPTPESSSNKKHSHANDFLIRGTLFTDTAMALPGAKLRIRRASERRFRWDSYSNSRGEFAIRVPQGTDYEMLVQAKGFTDETRPIDAKTGLSEGTLSIQMKKAAGGKS